MKPIKILFLLVFFSKNLFADIIYLQNGSQIEGKITQQTKEKVQIQRANGSIEVIDKKDIERITYGKTQKEILEEQKRKQEELKRKQEEELKRKQEEELKRKQEEELKRKQEEELKRKQEEELKRKQEEELKRKQEEELKRKQEKKSPYFVYLQSAMLPGLGYYNIHQKNKAYFWGGLFLTSLGYFVYNYQKTSFYKNEYFRNSDQLSNLMFLGIVSPFTLEDIFLTRTISKNRDLFRKYSQNLAYSGIFVLAVYVSQFYFLKQDLDIVAQKEVYFIENCRDCQTVFQYSTRF